MVRPGTSTAIFGWGTVIPQAPWPPQKISHGKNRSPESPKCKSVHRPACGVRDSTSFPDINVWGAGPSAATLALAQSPHPTPHCCLSRRAPRPPGKQGMLPSGRTFQGLRHHLLENQGQRSEVRSHLGSVKFSTAQHWKLLRVPAVPSWWSQTLQTLYNPTAASLWPRVSPPNHPRFPVLVCCKHGSLLPPGSLHGLLPLPWTSWLIPPPAQTLRACFPSLIESYTHTGFLFPLRPCLRQHLSWGCLWNTAFWGKECQKETGATDGSNPSKKGWFLARMEVKDRLSGMSLVVALQIYAYYKLVSFWKKLYKS